MAYLVEAEESPPVRKADCRAVCANPRSALCGSESGTSTSPPAAAQAEAYRSKEAHARDSQVDEPDG
jgi:hypothetical protein